MCCISVPNEYATGEVIHYMPEPIPGGRGQMIAISRPADGTCSRVYRDHIRSNRPTGVMGRGTACLDGMTPRHILGMERLRRRYFHTAANAAGREISPYPMNTYDARYRAHRASAYHRAWVRSA